MPEPYLNGSLIRDPARPRKRGLAGAARLGRVLHRRFAFALPPSGPRQLLTAAARWLLLGGIPRSTTFQVDSWPSAAR
ncbi:hypothetical protein L3Q65_24780 [Amycolatopsis sp. FU40]|nr:hypothetical protein L3Q65_24780 [Amycolatopsis sp. FU40]